MKPFVPAQRSVRRRLATVMAGAALLALGATSLSATTTYYSTGSVDPGVLTSWNSARNGSGASPADFTSGDVFVIQSGHNMGTTAAWTVSGTGNKIQIESGGTLTANNIVVTTTFQVDNGGTYVHNAVSGASNGADTDIPGTTRSFGASSTVEIQKWANGGTSPNPLPSPVNWGNLKINVTLLAGSWNQSSRLTNNAGGNGIQGDLIIALTGGTTREFRICANTPTTPVLTVGGSIKVSGGIFAVVSGTATPTLNVSGDVQVSGGVLNWAESTGSPTINITGTIAVTGGLVQSTGTGAGIPVITVNANSGKITVSGGGTNLLSGNYANPPVSPVADQITLDNGSFGNSGVDLTLNANSGITVAAAGGSLFTAAGRTMTIPANITGPGALTKTYAAGATTVNITLSGTNDFAGDFTLTGGGTRFNTSAAAGKGRVIVSPPVGGSANVTLRNLGVALTTLTNDVVFNANNGVRITLDSDTDKTFVMSGKFSGIGAVDHGVNSGGTVVLIGDNSAWSGGLTGRRGTTSLGHKNALGTATYTVAPPLTAGIMSVSLQAATPLTGINAVTNPVVFAVTNTAPNFSFLGANDLELSGAVTLGIPGSGSPTITNKNAGATILSGVINGTGFGLTLEGTGTTTLKGANTYDGNTVVNGGTLKVANTTGSATGSGSVTVAAGASLSGPGTISGTLTLNGTISPGSSPGTLTTGPEIWNGGGAYVWEINSTDGQEGVRSAGWDLLKVNGELRIAATPERPFVIRVASLTPDNAPGLATGFDSATEYAWRIVSTTGGISGFDRTAVALDTTGFAPALGQGSFALDTANGGNDLVLRFVQKPLEGGTLKAEATVRNAQPSTGSISRQSTPGAQTL